MRTLVIGAGAVGGYFGGRLAEAGRDVTFLLRPGRAEQIRRDGLQIVSPNGNVTLHPKILLAADLKQSPQTFDLILLATKAYSLNAAIEDFAPAVGPHTSILPLLNGMAHLDTLAARFGEQAVLGGTTRIVADMDAEGRVHQLESWHDFSLGEFDKSVTPRIQAVAAEVHNAGFDDRLSPDILTAMWQKWVLLASMASITCLLRGTIGAVVAVPGGAETARALITECAAIATANDYAPPEKLLDQITTRLTQPNSPLTASMYRDLQKGQPVEVESILGDLLQRGRAHNVPAPLLQATYVQLSIYAASLPVS